MRNYIRSIAAFFAVIFIMSIWCAGVYAAPEECSADIEGNTYDLVVITNPPEYKTSTFAQSYIVQGHAKEGTKITLYWLDAQNGVYRKIYSPFNYYNEYGELQTYYEEAAVTVGASNLFIKDIELSYGGNNIMIYAEKDGAYQIMKFNITLYNHSNLFDIIRSIAS